MGAMADHELKSDRFGMEIKNCEFSWVHSFLVKIRPFRYENLLSFLMSLKKLK